MTDQQIIEENQHKPRRSWAKLGIFFSTLGFIIFVFAFGYGYFELARVNVSLAQLVGDLKGRTTHTQDTVDGLQKSVDTLQQGLQKSQDLSSQQEQIMSEWKAAQQGDLEKWHVAEAQYLVTLANDELQFTHNSKLALQLLQRAAQVLQTIQDTALLDTQKALAADIASLQATPQTDVTRLFLRLNALDAQLDQLPLPINPLEAEKTQVKTPENFSALPWWKAGLEKTWQALSKVIIVRYNGSRSLPLVLPDEKMFLFQNLHAQMQNAIWGVLHHDGEVYQASLEHLITWIRQYLAQGAPETQTMVLNLDELRKETVQPPAVNLSDTLQLFDQYFAKAREAKATQ